jgi:hypothetical protein
MKINNADEILKGVFRKTTPKKEESNDKQFSEILKDSLSPTQKSEPLSQNHHILRSTPVINIQPAMVLQEAESTVVGRVYKLLNVLDDYRMKLGDPQMSLKEVDPVVKQLESENENLKPVLESLADGDKLKEIVNDALVTASLEVIKYKRGDYIPTSS